MGLAIVVVLLMYKREVITTQDWVNMAGSIASLAEPGPKISRLKKNVRSKILS